MVVWVLGLVLMGGSAEAEIPKVVLIAGTKSHGPGHHEYERAARLLAWCLEHSPNAPKLEIVVVTDGWPKEEAILDGARTIFLFSDGSDHRLESHPFFVGERLETLQRLMDAGCGLILMHYATFAPIDRGGPQFLDWVGGFFDYQSGEGKPPWLSRITTCRSLCEPADNEHPILEGIGPFQLEEEYYYRIRFRDQPPSIHPLLTTMIPDEPDRQTIAWALQREKGRGMGFTGGHFHANWRIPEYRRLLLNALVWTAGLEVPQGGIQSTLPDGFEQDQEDLERQNPAARVESAHNPDPIRVLLLTGHNGPFHDWRATTQAIEEALARDERFEIRVVDDPEFLAVGSLGDYDLIVQNYVNWDRPSPSTAAREALLTAVRQGTGLVLVHFANGAFRDWPEYAQLSRRRWVDGKSNHDAFGPFRVNIADREQPITARMPDFDTVDELYCDQVGDEPIHVLATARSQVTGRDEPIAFVYEEGGGRVFQTLLGHDGPSLRFAGPAEMLRRGCAWSARREVRRLPVDVAEPASPAPTQATEKWGEGRFGRGLVGGVERLWAESHGDFFNLPITVECWAKLDSKAGYNLLVAAAAKESASHWELYSNVGDGHFHVYLPGWNPAVVDSGVDVVDGQWHHLTMTLTPGEVQLFVDGRQAAKQPLAGGVGLGFPGPVELGGYAAGGLSCVGVLDEVRITKGLRPPSQLPAEPLAVEERTIALWNFEPTDDGDPDQVPDLAGRHPARFGSPVYPAPPIDGEASPTVAVNPGVRVTVVDRSETDSFLAIRSDSEGRLFVGGRETLFLYEPNQDGTFAPRRALYSFPADSWINDIEIRGEDLYVATSAAIYRLPEARRLPMDATPKVERLVWGLPLDLHVSYHGLAWGPEGDLYFCHGDPLLNYGDFENRPDHWGHWMTYSGPDSIPTTGVGGVFRIHPDGTGLRRVASGLRGCFGLTFDPEWNLFTNDNDHESLPARYVPARLLHVAAGVDFAWPRGWMASKTPERADLVDSMNEELGREVPVAQAFYADSRLQNVLGHSLLLTRWGQRRVDAYRLKTAGASFRAELEPFLVGENMARPVGVAVGADGRIFAAISIMRANEWSPRYPSELLEIDRSEFQEPATGQSPASSFPLMDLTKLEDEALWNRLAAPDWSIRRLAHGELLRRGSDRLQPAVARLSSAQDYERFHLPWLAAATGIQEARTALIQAVRGKDRELAIQSLRAVLEWFPDSVDELAGPILANGSPAEVFAVVSTLLDRNTVDSAILTAVARGPARSSDRVLRQVATRLLAEKSAFEPLANLATSPDTEGRLAAVLAIGVRLTVPPPFGPVPSPLPQPYTSGNAVFEIPFAGEQVDLRKLASVGSFTTAEWWRLVPTSAEHRALADLLADRLEDASPAVRRQAAYYLNLLDDASYQPRVNAVLREEGASRLATAPFRPVSQVWLIGPFLPEADPHLDRQAIDLSEPITVAGKSLRWTAQNLGDIKDRGVWSPGIWYAYFRLETTGVQPAILSAEKDEEGEDSGDANGQVRWWWNGRPVGEWVELQPGSNDLLVRMKLAGEGTLAQPRLLVRADESVRTTLPEAMWATTLAARLREAAGQEGTSIPEAFLEVDWPNAIAAGDWDRGRKLFGADGLGCIKCHSISTAQAGNGAPSLAGAAQRFTIPHLVESVLAPDKQVGDLFRATLVVTTEGETLQGLVVREDAERLEIILPDATRRELRLADIEARRQMDRSPMPAGLVKDPRELADLLAYLLQQD